MHLLEMKRCITNSQWNSLIQMKKTAGEFGYKKTCKFKLTYFGFLAILLESKNASSDN
jgi:hypothetical protein